MLGRQFEQPRLMSQQDHFSRVPTVSAPRSSFSLDHQHKTTLNEGKLVPILLQEVLPGDTFKCTATTFGRLLAQKVPVMDNIYADIHFWFVPNRLVWSHWVNFNGEEAVPSGITPQPTYVVPVVDWTHTGSPVSVEVGSIADYFGLPIGTVMGASQEKISALPFRALCLIYDEWYRDENFGAPRFNGPSGVGMGDGPDDAWAQGFYNAAGLMNRWKRKDYITSCLPWTQKGTAPTLPLGTTANVYTAAVTSGSAGGNWWQAWRADGTRTGGGVNVNNNATTASRTLYGGALADSTNTASRFALGTAADYAANPSYTPPYADLANAIGPTVTAMRQAVAIQQFLENQARGGTRYTEMLSHRFGVTNPDARLQRPEFLGGGSTMLNQAPIPQTSETNAGVSPQGNLAAIATMSQKAGFAQSFTEHGYIIGLISIRADITYQNRIDRHWSRQTLYDFYQPEFAHISEQAVYRREVSAVSVGATNAEAFGYQEAWADYRSKLSLITGQFRSQAASSLDVWHLAQDLGSGAPALTASFLYESPPISRLVAVTTQPHFQLDVSFKMSAARVMPVFSVPGLGKL